MSSQVEFRAWRTGGEFAAGTHAGTGVMDGHLCFERATETVSYVDPYSDRGPVQYECATWTSPEVVPGFRADQVVPSWNGGTPDHSWLSVEVRLSTAPGTWSRWFLLARWAETLEEIHRCSQDGQRGDSAEVLTDYVRAIDGTRWRAYQLRVRLMRPVGGSARPTLRLLAGVASAPDPDLGDRALSSASPPPRDTAAELAVPTYSQQPLRDRYPGWDAGGQSWCSPTSTTMVLHAWGLGPRREEYAWVAADLKNPFIVSAVRDVYDHAYGGCGNWSFNTAYAARFGATAFITKLRSLDEAELFIAAGVPLVASVAFDEGQLSGAGYSTTGHLLCVVGFDRNGDVICNDPASHGNASDGEVRVVYDRGEFAHAWEASDGVVYVIHPPDVALPNAPVPDQPNW